jgi:hypothetical protein
MQDNSAPTTEQLDEDFQRNVITAINNEEDIAFIIYAGIDTTDEKITFTLAKILEKHKMVDIFTPVHSCIKELIANATKAIAKRILIEEGVITNINDAKETVVKIKSILNKDALMEYGIKAKYRDLSTRLYLKVKNNNLIVEVINNTPVTNKEYQRMLAKIEAASKYDNIAEFYLENPDPEAEGMGLGLSMIVVLLKNINISYKNFILSSDKQTKTYTKLLIPLTR